LNEVLFLPMPSDSGSDVRGAGAIETVYHPTTDETCSTCYEDWPIQMLWAWYHPNWYTNLAFAEKSPPEYFESTMNLTARRLLEAPKRVSRHGATGLLGAGKGRRVDLLKDLIIIGVVSGS